MVSTPELKKYLDKKVLLNLNSQRQLIGQLRGYDIFLNIVLENALEIQKNDEKIEIGSAVIRGNSILSIENLES